MKYSEAELVIAGLKPDQARLLRQQHHHLRNEGHTTTLDALALRSRFVSEDELVDARAEQDAGLPSHTLLHSLLPLEWCKRWCCRPTEFSRGVLTLDAGMPLTEAQVERIRQMLTLKVQEVKVRPVPRMVILSALQTLEKSDSPVGLMSLLRKQGLEAGLLRRLVFALLQEALSLRASDIHLNKKSDPDAWVAYRIDSVMQQVHLLPQLLMQSLVARIKIEAGMDASNSRSAQDGRLSIDYQGRVVDFRISSQPLVDGESLVMRALDAAQLPGLKTLLPGQPRMMDILRNLMNGQTKAGGLVLITGATGSGKSTTQYTLACGFKRDSVNLITVEDPVEYLLPFAKQIQLQALIKQRAIELERSILRQDPDVLIFGEIRDADSARAALAFAESGHLVISTLHANSVLQVQERFLSIIDPVYRQDAEFLLAHYLRLIMHQRLVVRLCSCAQPLQAKEFDDLQECIDRLTGGVFHLSRQARRAQGCERCQGSGYLGRVAAHETVHVPMEEHSRSQFVKALQTHALELPADLTESNGVEYISRATTLQTLMDQGVVDWPTVARCLGLSEY